MAAPLFRNALPQQSMLQEYRIEEVLGAGGFGITYRARDTNLEKDVAIKEYLPGELAMRAPDGNVVVQATDREAGYKWGLERFLQETRTLARFSHPHIVRVLRYFEANATAYMVMDYEKGDSLKVVLQHDPQPPEHRLKALVAPLLDGLAAVHAAGFLHRDIKPDNVFVRTDGRPVLIDFGAARQALGGETRSLTSILTPGYAPLEQYPGEGKQGPWTDLYSMGGVLYRAVVDKNPPDAVSRVRGDSLGANLAATRGRYSEPFLRAIEWALALDEKRRPQSVGQWKTALLSGDAVVSIPERRTEETAEGEELEKTRMQIRAYRTAGSKRGLGNFLLWFFGFLFAIGALMLVRVALGFEPHANVPGAVFMQVVFGLLTFAGFQIRRAGLRVKEELKVEELEKTGMQIRAYRAAAVRRGLGNILRWFFGFVLFMLFAALLVSKDSPEDRAASLPALLFAVVACGLLTFAGFRLRGTGLRLKEELEARAKKEGNFYCCRCGEPMKDYSIVHYVFCCLPPWGFIALFFKLKKCAKCGKPYPERLLAAR